MLDIRKNYLVFQFVLQTNLTTKATFPVIDISGSTGSIQLNIGRQIIDKIQFFKQFWKTRYTISSSRKLKEISQGLKTSDTINNARFKIEAITKKADVNQLKYIKDQENKEIMKKRLNRHSNTIIVNDHNIKRTVIYIFFFLLNIFLEYD